MGTVGYTDENGTFHKTVTNDNISKNAGNQIVRGTDSGLYVGMPFKSYTNEAAFKADYDAQNIPPNTQVYVNEDFANSNNTYSTEETVCGTWIDGKPIYRRVFNNLTCCATVNTANNLIDLVDFDIDEIINIYGYSTGTNGRKTFVNSYRGSGTNVVALNVWNGGGNIFETHTHAYENNQPLMLVVEYTKTTD